LDKIATLIRDVKHQGHGSNALDKVLDIALNHPETVADLVLSIMDELPGGGTFHDAALSFLPMPDWPVVIQHSLSALERTTENEAAEATIAYASLQSVSALHPYLERIFALNPNSQSYYANWPWRDSGTQNFAFLRGVFERSSSDLESRQKAWDAMLETREAEVLQFAAEQGPLLDLAGGVEAHLHQIGYELTNGQQRQLYPDCVYHLSFPPTYGVDPTMPYWLRVHPTWKLQPLGAAPMKFGGEGSGACGLCGCQLHHVLTLEPIPQGVAVSDQQRLILETCLSCLGWEAETLFYVHDVDGRPEPVGYDGPRVEPGFPAEPLEPTEVSLAASGTRWRWQDWALSNSRENLHRVGGFPCWIQSAQFPRCPGCGRTMGFLLQLDSELPICGGGDWLWGSGGIGYFFWCDECKTSACIWQCT
jgi:hypothetical protein